MLQRISLPGGVLFLRIVSGAIALGLLAGSASAQELKPEVRSGTRIPTRLEHYSPERAQQIVHAFAACLAKRRRPLASAYILDRTTLVTDKYQKLLDPDCAGDAFTDADFDADVQLKMGGDALRFALAEALLATEIDKIDPAQLPKAGQLPIPAVTPWSDRQGSANDREKGVAADKAMILWYKFGDCAVHANPLASKALLSTAIGSTAEADAVQAMVPTLDSCVEKGTQLALNRTSLRGALALAYYSLAHTPISGAMPVSSQR
jgi:hypothetical protein